MIPTPIPTPESESESLFDSDSGVGIAPGLAETALVRIHNDMMQSMDCRRGVLLVLLDLSAAYDTLDHGILLKRLHDIGVRHTALEWFKSYLDDRTFTVRIGQTMSARSEVRCGVPQGSVLGSMLFNVHILSAYQGYICKAQSPLSHLR